ncbi:hypothetical protein NLJ89_g11484 [Agrocybe chaxingu]|uniref:Uncharacterized protein n=1 Tax=Agrocybe chaxingu TaxID=84603 RepID=A0A9W8MRL0_9AGAR|nr:hypothetical protein NLJ89_g11484 [Agrocybe chaxingu]
MVNPGAFHGPRKEFLVSEKPAYAAGVGGGYAADALAIIQRRYLKRWPVDFPHDQEQTPEFLAAVDDDAPDEEYAIPQEEGMDPEAYAEALKRCAEHQYVLRFRKAQIKRWMAYQYMKDHDLDPHDSGLSNPYRVLLRKLTGEAGKRPRLKTPANLWRRSHRDEVEEAVKRRAIAEGTSRKQLAALREKVAKEMLAIIPQEEKDEWAAQAKEEHDAAVEQWKNSLTAPLSTAPADRQRCIQGLVRFMQPILDLTSEATGLAITVMAGGPEPAHAGRLNVISVHAGKTPGDIKMNFGARNDCVIESFFVPIFGSFLQKLYTPEECRSRALAPEEGFEPLESMDLDAEGATFDSLDSQLDDLLSDSHLIAQSTPTC